MNFTTQHWFINPRPFDLNLVYSYVIKVADSEYQLRLHSNILVSKIFAFYQLQEIALCLPGRRDYVPNSAHL